MTGMLLQHDRHEAKMSTSISFLELRLEAGELIPVLGSGEIEDVLARALSQPFVRICMQDPEVVDFRVRCGTAELTDSGLDYSLWDEFQSRGASVRLFAWSTSIMRLMGGNSDAVRELLLERSSDWLEFSEGVFSKVEEAPARRALSTRLPSADSRVLIQFHVSPAYADEVLALLRRDSHSEIENEPADQTESGQGPE